jgi:hypothetical protein
MKTGNGASKHGAVRVLAKDSENLKGDSGGNYEKQYSNQYGLRNTTVGYGLYFRYRNPRTLPI